MEIIHLPQLQITYLIEMPFNILQCTGPHSSLPHHSDINTHTHTIKNYLIQNIKSAELRKLLHGNCNLSDYGFPLQNYGGLKEVIQYLKTAKNKRSF